MGQLPDSLPVFLLPDVPLNWETLGIIFPASATLAVVGLLESMMTAGARRRRMSWPFDVALPPSLPVLVTDSRSA